MSLTKQSKNLTTTWKPVILDFLNSNPDIDETYDEKCSEIGVPIYPPINMIFRCFEYCNINDTKIVILGQDPYHGPKQAIGLCFGVEETMKTPPSLRNIMKKLTEEYKTFHTTSTLEHWAKQGILMLNASLTVRHKSPSSHMKLWKNFTGSIIKYLNDHCQGIVFIAWGAFAHNIIEKHVNFNKHHLITSSHPSPLSAYRKYKSNPSFKESSPFVKANKLLKYPIEW